jgi:hypothetical protein
MAVSNVVLNQAGNTAFERRKDLFDVTTDYAATRTSGFLKALYVLPGLAKNLGYLPSDHAGLNGFCSGAKFGKLALAPTSLVDKVQTLQTSTAHWLRGSEKSFKQKYGQSEKRKVTTLDVIRDASSCVGPSWETTDFLRTVLISIPKASLRVFEGINGIALAFSMGCNLLLNTCTWIKDSNYPSLKGAARDQKLTEMAGYLLKMAMEVSYVVLGIMVALSCFFQVVFSPLAFSAVSASTVVFSILEYYHENLGTKKNLLN